MKVLFFLATFSPLMSQTEACYVIENSMKLESDYSEVLREIPCEQFNSVDSLCIFKISTKTAESEEYHKDSVLYWSSGEVYISYKLDSLGRILPGIYFGYDELGNIEFRKEVSKRKSNNGRTLVRTLYLGPFELYRHQNILLDTTYEDIGVANAYNQGGSYLINRVNGYGVFQVVSLGYGVDNGILNIRGFNSRLLFENGSSFQRPHGWNFIASNNYKSFTVYREDYGEIVEGITAGEVNGVESLSKTSSSTMALDSNNFAHFLHLNKGTLKIAWKEQYGSLELIEYIKDSYPEEPFYKNENSSKIFINEDLGWVEHIQFIKDGALYREDGYKNCRLVISRVWEGDGYYIYRYDYPSGKITREREKELERVRIGR